MYDEELAEDILSYLEDGERTYNVIADGLASAIVEVTKRAYPTERRQIVREVFDILEEIDG